MRSFVLSVLLLLSFSLLAQPLHDSVSVEVVNVPVFVTRGDAAVQGLTRADFELLVNGKAQPIEYFDVVDATTSPSALRERRLFLLVFDLAFSRIHAIPREQKAAATLIANAPASDLFAIATYSQRRGLTFATPFTRNRASLARAITSLATTKSGDPLSIVMTPAERTALESGEVEASQVAGTTLRDLWIAPTARAAEDQMVDLKELSERLGSLQGQKHVVLLSEGFDRVARPATKVASFNRSAVEAQIDSGNELYTTMFNARVLGLADEMKDAFRKSDVFLHTLDLTGIGSLASGDALNLLASSTGGRYMHNENDFGSALTKLSRAYDHSYMLGFVPRDVKPGMNSITVRLRNAPRATNVEHRKGFSGTRTPIDVNEGLYVADVLLNDVPQTGTAPRLELIDGTLRAHVPMEPLAAQVGAAGTAEMLIYAFDANGTPVGFHRQIIEVDTTTGEKTYDITLPAGATTAKALLRAGESLGFSRT